MTSPCPSSAELAALAGDRLPLERVAAVRAHLASCEDCLEAVSEAAVFAEEEAEGLASSAAAAPSPRAPAATTQGGAAPPGRPGVVVPLPARRPAAPWARWGAVAAALLAVVGIALWWSASRRGGVEALYAAAADPRPGDVRLSGAPYQAPEPVLRGEREAPRWRLLAAAERARAAAEEDPSARNLHALGVAHLLLGEAGPAIAALERARQAAPDDARIASDLAAALVHRGLAEDRPRDLAAGLELLAGAGEDLGPEDRFNRALALERIGPPAAAAAAWEGYLERDPGSPWAGEARERLDRLRR